MNRKVSDTQIKSFVRSHVVRHELDPERLQLRVLSGAVTVSGEAWHPAGPTATQEALQKLERDVLATTGVRHFCSELANWNRLEYGVWRPVGETPREVSPAISVRHGNVELLPALAPMEETTAHWSEPSSCFVAPITMDELLEARFRSPGA